MSNSSNINSDNFSIKLISNNYESYNLKINIENNELNFNCSSIYGYNNKKINQSYSFEELQIINDLFSLYNNINEIYDVLKALFYNSKQNDHKYPSIEENEKENTFNIILFPNLGKIQFIKIPLISKIEKENIKIDEKILDEIEEDVKQLDSFIEKNKKEITNLKIENNNLKKQIEMNKKNDTKFVVTKNQRKIENFYFTIYNFHAEEFISKNKMDILKDWIIKKFFYFKKKNLKFSVIYKATVDGDSAINFHKKVDGIGPIIIIVKTVDHKIIGGYTSKPWSSSNKVQMDSDAFLFTLESFKIYEIKNSKKPSCVHFINQGPCFGNTYELFISNNCLKNKQSAVNGISESFNFYDNKNLLNEPGMTNFQVLDYEVYKLIW